VYFIGRRRTIGFLTVKTLFVLGSRSWLVWITPFLDRLQENVGYVFDEDSSPGASARLLETVDRSGASDVIFISHHQTLSRDAAVGCQLDTRGAGTFVYQPSRVVNLATDKRRMAEIAREVPGASVIKELTFAEACGRLTGASPRPVVVKNPGLTEGHGFTIVTDPTALRSSLERSANGNADLLVQPFVEGDEFSVNVAVVRGRSWVFPPVWKGRNSTLEWLHPSRRTRLCPAPQDRQLAAKRLAALATTYCRLCGASGLAELEFIVDDEGQIWFLEINPRLAATVRMNSMASKPDIFSALLDLASAPRGAKNSHAAVAAYTREVPLKPDLPLSKLMEAFRFPEYSFSTRACTVSGRTAYELDTNYGRLKDGIRALS